VYGEEAVGGGGGRWWLVVGEVEERARDFGPVAVLARQPHGHVTTRSKPGSWRKQIGAHPAHGRSVERAVGAETAKSEARARQAVRPFDLYISVKTHR
jgi:hypothetical protein